MAGNISRQKEIEGVGIKICLSCKQEKPLLEFSTGGQKRRRKTQCKTCRNKTGKRRDTKHDMENRMLLLKGLKKCSKCKEIKNIRDYHWLHCRRSPKPRCKHCTSTRKTPPISPLINAYQPTYQLRKKVVFILKKRILSLKRFQRDIERAAKRVQRDIYRVAVSSFLEWRKSVASKEWLDGWKKGLRQRYLCKGGSEIQKRWRANNPEKVNWMRKVVALRKRKRIRAVDDKTLNSNVIRRLLENTKNCPYCGEGLSCNNTHLDHINPLSKGGKHSITNVIPCCAFCNGRKSDKPFNSWLEYLQEPHKTKARSMYENKDWGLGF